MKWFNFLSMFSDTPVEPVSLGVEAAHIPPCPHPLSSDNGTMAECKAKHHCDCEDK